MSKYKVGDKVRVRTDLISDTDKYLRHTSRKPIHVDYSMLNFKGQILIIKEVVRNEYYKVKGTNWVWTDDMLEPVSVSSKPIQVGDWVERVAVVSEKHRAVMSKGNKYKVIGVSFPRKYVELEDVPYGKYWNVSNFKLTQPPQLPKKEQPMQQKQKEKKLKIFLKDGSINIKGIMYQLAKKTQTTTHLPFVNKAIADELARVKRATRDITQKAINYNIKLAATLENFKEASKVKHVMTPTDAVMFYEYEKAHGSFDWIKKYLTSKNVTSTTPVDLFKSNNRHIYICEGIIYLEEKDLVFATTIKFDKKTKQFFL